MRWIAVTICATLVLGLAGLYVLRNSLRSNFGGQDQPTTMVGDFANLTFPANDAKGTERVEQWRKVSYDTCAAQSVVLLARQLRTKATPEAVARGYARYARQPAVYEACLRGLRD